MEPKWIPNQSRSASDYCVHASIETNDIGNVFDHLYFRSCPTTRHPLAPATAMNTGWFVSILDGSSLGSLYQGVWDLSRFGCLSFVTLSLGAWELGWPRAIS